MGKSMAVCSSGNWSYDTKKISCTEGVALLSGSWHKTKRNSTMEVYGPDMSIMVGLLPLYVYLHRVIYVDEYLVLCDEFPTSRKSYYKCFKLVINLQADKRGCGKLLVYYMYRYTRKFCKLNQY